MRNENFLVTCCCGYAFDVEDSQQFGHCPLCENDNVEVHKNDNSL
jgi:predicted Zn-ribbon and HTH transcriptional regulator